MVEGAADVRDADLGRRTAHDRLSRRAVVDRGLRLGLAAGLMAGADGQGSAASSELVRKIGAVESQP